MKRKAKLILSPCTYILSPSEGIVGSSGFKNLDPEKYSFSFKERIIPYEGYVGLGFVVEEKSGQREFRLLMGRQRD